MLFTSCLKEEIPFQYTIRVYISDYENNNIEDVNITLKYLKDGRNNYTYVYNLDGYYEFTGLIDIGEYQIWVYDIGNIYKDNYEGVTLDENKIESINIKLEKY